MRKDRLCATELGSNRFGELLLLPCPCTFPIASPKTSPSADALAVVVERTAFEPRSPIESVSSLCNLCVQGSDTTPWSLPTPSGGRGRFNCDVGSDLVSVEQFAVKRCMKFNFYFVDAPKSTGLVLKGRFNRPRSTSLSPNQQSDSWRGTSSTCRLMCHFLNGRSFSHRSSRRT